MRHINLNEFNVPESKTRNPKKYNKLEQSQRFIFLEESSPWKLLFSEPNRNFVRNNNLQLYQSNCLKIRFRPYRIEDFVFDGWLSNWLQLLYQAQKYFHLIWFIFFRKFLKCIRRVLKIDFLRISRRIFYAIVLLI